MSLINRKGLLDVVSVFVQAKRFKGKINIQKPRKPHFEKALLLQVTKPYFLKNEAARARELLCDRQLPNLKNNVENPLQKIYSKELLEKFKTSKLIAIYHKNPISAEVEFNAFAAFHKINMEYKVYGKETLAMALENSAYKPMLGMYVSQNALVFAKDPDIKKMLKVNKKFPQIILLAAIYEGQFISKDEIVKLSTLGNLQTARAELVQTINSAAQQFVQLLDATPQSLVASLESRSKQLGSQNNEEK